MHPDAVRQRRKRENDQLAQKAAELAARITGASSPAPANANDLPLHETSPVTEPAPEAFEMVPVLAVAGGEPKPIVPEQPTGSTSDGAAQANTKPPITAEEAKMFGQLVKGYFDFGSRQLFVKHPEFIEGLVQMSGTPDNFNRNYAIAGALVAQCAERVALKYNLRIPYVDEAVVITAIGVATFGLAGKPSKRGQAAIDEQGRAKNAKDGNAPPKSREDVTRDERDSRPADVTPVVDDEELWKDEEK